MKKALFLYLVLMQFYLSAQQLQWAIKITDEKPNALSALDNSGNVFLIAGSTGYKISSSGQVMNQHNFPSQLDINDLKINSNNDLIVAGQGLGTFTLGTTQFSPAGWSDAFLGSFSSSFQSNWGKCFGGKSGDRAMGLAVGNGDDIFLCAGISDTAKIDGINFICSSSQGKGFVGRFSPNGNLKWGYRDSSDDYNTTSTLFQKIYRNKNNEFQVWGTTGAQGNFSCNNSTLVIPPGGYSTYYFELGLKIDDMANPLFTTGVYNTWGPRYRYEGLTSKNSFLIMQNTINGDFSTMTVLDTSGVITDTIPFVHHQSDYNRITFLNVINDEAYFLYSGTDYDSTGEHRPNYIYKVISGKPVITGYFEGKVWDCALHKDASDNFYLAGVFTKYLRAGNNTLKTDSLYTTGTTSVYKAHPFVIKYKETTLQSGILSHEKKPAFKVFPNPCNGSFRIGSDMKSPGILRVYNSLGQLVYKSQMEVMEPDKFLSISLNEKGIYLLEFLGSDNFSATKKIIVE